MALGLLFVAIPFVAIIALYVFLKTLDDDGGDDQ